MIITYRGKMYGFYCMREYNLTGDYDGASLIEFMENNCDYFEVFD